MYAPTATAPTTPTLPPDLAEDLIATRAAVTAARDAAAAAADTHRDAVAAYRQALTRTGLGLAALERLGYPPVADVEWRPVDTRTPRRRMGAG